MSNTKKTQKKSDYIICDEWIGEVVKGEFKPLKKVRENVKLTPSVMEAMNGCTTEMNPYKYIAQSENHNNG